MADNNTIIIGTKAPVVDSPDNTVTIYVDETTKTIMSVTDDGVTTDYTAGQTDQSVRVSVADTTSDYLGNKVALSSGTNTTNILEKSILTPAGDEKLQIQIDQTKINHNNLLNTHNITTDISHASISNLSYASSGHTGFEPTMQASQTIYVSKIGNDTTGIGTITNPYLTIKKALTSANAAAAEATPYRVYVDAGVYVEEELFVASYVYLSGESIFSVIIEADDVDHHVINLAEMTEISFVTLKGAGTGYAGINATNCGDYAQAHKVSIVDCDFGIVANATTVDSYLYLEYVDIEQALTNAFLSNAVDGFIAEINVENFYIYPPELFTGSSVVLNGAGVLYKSTVSSVVGQGTDKGYTVGDGAYLSLSASILENCGIGIEDTIAGAGVTLELSALDFNNCAVNIHVDNVDTIGRLNGDSAYEKVHVVSGSQFYVSNRNARTITVASSGANFTSIIDAMDAVTNPSKENPWVIKIGPGTFEVTESIVMKPWTRIVGESEDTTFITAPDESDFDLIVGADDAGISFCTLSVINQATNRWLIHYASESAGASKVFMAFRVRFGWGYGLAYCDSSLGYSVLILQSCLLGNGYTFTKGFLCDNSSSGELGRIVGFQTSSTGGIKTSASGTTYPEYVLKVANAGCEVIMCASFVYTNAINESIFAVAENGGTFRFQGMTIKNFLTGIQTNNSGAAPAIDVTGFSCINCTNDLLINHPSTTGAIQGEMDKSKITIDEDVTGLTLSYLNVGTGVGSVTIGDIYQATRHDRLLSISDLLRKTATVGLVEGGEITVDTGTTIDVTAGYGYLIDPTDSFIKLVSWEASSIASLSGNNTHYIYVDTTGAVSSATSAPDTLETISLGRVRTDSSTICFISNVAIEATQRSNAVETMLRNALGPIYISGSTVTENGNRGLDITAGSYNFGTINIVPTGGTGVSWEEYFHVSSAWSHNGSVSTIQNTNYDLVGTGLTAMTTDYYRKDALYITEDGVDEKIFIVTGQEEFSTLLAAQAGNIPVPPTWFTDSVVLIADIIIKKGATNIIQIDDQRPRIGFKPTAISSSGSHSDLLGLSADDHTQYLLVSGSRAMSGNLTMNNNNIVTGTGLVDGVDVSTHASRHLPNSVTDPLTCAAAVAVSTTSTEGTANSLSRSDHTHAGVSTYKVNGGTARVGAVNFVDGNSVTITDNGSGNITIATTGATSKLLPTIGTGLAIDYTEGSVLMDGTYTTIASGSFTVPAGASNYWFFVNTSGVLAQASSLPAGAVAICQFSTDGSSVTSLSDRRVFIPTNHIFAAPTASLSATTTNAEGSLHSGTRSDHSHAILTGVVSTQLPDLANAAGSSANLAKADHIHNIPAAIPISVGAANFKGTAQSVALSDHVHNHGSQTTATHHAVATPSANGFLSSTDKYKLDSFTSCITTTTQSVSGAGVWATSVELVTPSLDAGTYNIFASIGAQSVSSANGMGLRLNAVTATMSGVAIKWQIPHGANGTDQTYIYDQITPTQNTNSSSFSVANTKAVALGQGTFTLSGAGTVALEFRNELNRSAVTLLADSILFITRMT